jgi:hypothetical protein
MKNKLIVGKEYKSYGKYIGIVRNIMYNKYDYEEHRFSVSKGINEIAMINTIRVEDFDAIDQILKDN